MRYGFNIFSPHQAQARPTIINDKDGVHLFDNRLIFPRYSIGSCLYGIHMDPTRTAGRTAVSTLSGVLIPPVSHTTEPGVSLAPPLLLSPPFNVDKAGPSAFDSHPLSHQNVEGVVTADNGFPPAFHGVVPQDANLQPIICGVIPVILCFPSSA